MRLRWGAALLAAGVACGCASVPRTHYYVLETGSAAQAEAAVASAERPAAARSIGVRRFRIDPPYDQDRIVYRIGADSVEIGFYAYHRWAVPLSEMLPAMTARSLHGAPGVKLVEPVRADGVYDLILQGRLLRLEEVDEPGGSRVVARVALSWRDSAGALLGTREGTAEVAAAGGEVSAIVTTMAKAMEAALAEALGQLPPPTGE